MNVVYQGPSLIDGASIFLAITGVERPSENIKTGPMAQTWILRSDIPPIEAVKSGQDSSVCGSCPLKGKECYVTVHRSPTGVFKQYTQGDFSTRYPVLKGRVLRIGSYGNPSAVPTAIWDRLIRAASGHTGYCFQPPDDLKGKVMASAHSRAAALEWQSRGFRTFRVKNQEDSLLPGEIYCPSYKGVQCISCQKCDGKKANVAIDIHGSSNKVKLFNRRAA